VHYLGQLKLKVVDAATNGSSVWEGVDGVPGRHRGGFGGQRKKSVSVGGERPEFAQKLQFRITSPGLEFAKSGKRKKGQGRKASSVWCDKNSLFSRESSK